MIYRVCYRFLNLITDTFMCKHQEPLLWLLCHLHGFLWTLMSNQQEIILAGMYLCFEIYFLPTPVLTWLRLSHFFRLGSNSDIAWKINAEIVTKHVAVTIAELFSYIKHENANMRMRRYKSCLFFTNLLWYSWVLLIIFNILL